MTIQPLHTLLSIVSAIAAAAALAMIVYRARLLNAGGAVAAVLVGATVFVCGGAAGAAALLVFFFSSSLLGRFRRAAKAKLGFEKGGRRDGWQVLANGGAATALVALACLPRWPSEMLRLGFLAALAEANADTWATEIGAGIGWTPRLITTFRFAAPGESGGVSAPGTLAALLGSALIGALALPVYHLQGWTVVTLVGFAGALIDSLLGATVQAQYALPQTDGPSPVAQKRFTETRRAGERVAHGIAGVNNDVVNCIATVAAAALGMIAWAIYIR